MSAPLRVSLVSLGCPKNLVDSEVILGHAVEEGFLVAEDPAEADVAVVNTCAFLDEARQESFQAIREVVRLKEEGELRGVVVAGCLSQRLGDAVLREVPGVDAVVGISDYRGMPALLQRIAARAPRRYVARLKGGRPKTALSDRTRLLLTPRAYAYLRIGEGCDHTCAFCAIPLMRGKHTSKPIEVLVEEARGLASAGVRELLLVAEDSTDYGMDRYRRRRLHELLEALSEVEGIGWIRVLYAYPHTVGPELTAVLRENEKVVPYLDIPIQHISGRILKAMKRGVSGEQVRRILDRLRAEVPGIAVRTTLIAGFPGETGEEFEELLRFVEEYRFERLGAFPFSPEEGTPAFSLPGRLPREVVRERLDRIMEAERLVIEERNRSLVGSVQRVLVDGRCPRSGRWTGRTFADAPEIDCAVFLAGEGFAPGLFADVAVTGTEGFDLLAAPAAAPAAPAATPPAPIAADAAGARAGP